MTTTAADVKLKLEVVDCLVLVAKCPKPGSSKSRLIPVFGEDFAHEIARSMLLDILKQYGQAAELHDLCKYFLYAPPSDEETAKDLLLEAKASESWTLMPANGGIDLKDVNLSNLLRTALDDVRAKHERCTVVFIGMDCPHLPSIEISNACSEGKNCKAYICPALDGGYTLIGIPPSAPTSIFNDILWSSTETCSMQVQRLVEHGVHVSFGQSYLDIDTPDDIAIWNAEHRRKPQDNSLCPLTSAIISKMS